MPHLPDEPLHCDTLSVGATRPAMLKGIPFGFIPVIFFSAAACVFMTRDPLWLLLMVPMALGVRALIAKDHNMPRVLLLWLRSGSALADRAVWGGESHDPLGPPGPWFGDAS